MNSKSLLSSSHGATVFKLKSCYIQVQFINRVLYLGGRITETSPSASRGRCLLWFNSSLLMTNDLTFTVNFLFDNLTFDKDAESWTFAFGDKFFANASGFWRLFKNNKILFVSLDHGHKFGLDKPFDLIEEIKNTLKGQRLTRIEVDKDVGDLTLTMTDQLFLEIYIASGAYDTYDFTLNNKRYIGLGSGDIAIMDIP